MKERKKEWKKTTEMCLIDSMPLHLRDHRSHKQSKKCDRVHENASEEKKTEVIEPIYVQWRFPEKNQMAEKHA